ncbi:MAG: tryptophan 7-halogenase [Henriciella sp.]|uniref:tryptophan 7-halogenase n=1 Tax=Henriciella sp. TaxID=1968823 RepID=UPI003C7845CC
MTRTLSILGGGLEGWLTALFAARKLEGLCDRVVVVPSGKVEETGAAVVYPQSRSLLLDLGLNEEKLVREADGAFLLGAKFGAAPGYVLAFGAYGAPANSVAFHHYWTRMKDAERAAPFDAYSLGAEMARLGRFVHPVSDPKRLESSFGYGLVLDRAKVSALVEAEARAAGVEMADAPPQDVWLQIDSRAMAVGLPDFVAWTDLPDVGRTRVEDAPKGNANMSCWSVDNSADDLSVTLSSRSRSYKMTWFDKNAHVAGRLAAPWTERSVCLGQASHALPGVLQTDLLLLLAQLGLLASLLPASDQPADIVAREYNRRAARMMDYVADMEALVISAGKLADGEIASPSLARRLQQFRSRGRVVTYDDELFSEQDWIAAIIGFHAVPERVSPLALGAPIEAVARNYDGLRQAIGRAVSRLPDQQTYLAHLLEEEGAG